ncbi:MAG: hypothetical protein AAF750_16860 [Planctomycetota bacterium]
MDSGPDAVRGVLASLGAAFIPWGPPPEEGVGEIELAESFGAYEAEYGAIRQRVGLMDLPMRGVLEMQGGEVKDFLHRLLSCEMNGRSGGVSFGGMLLSDDGKVLADLVVHQGDDSTWLEGDVFDLPGVREALDRRLFAEDVELAEAETFRGRRCFWLVGPAAVKALSAVAVADQSAAGHEGMSGEQVVERMGGAAGTHHVVALEGGSGGALATVYRWDLGRVLGVRVMVQQGDAAAVYGQLLGAVGYEMEPGEVGDGGMDAEAASANWVGWAERRRAGLRGRPVGWSAMNTVRIEEGVVWPHVDFGPDAQPAELGKVKFESAVSLTKGCYVGQEAVARMHNLSHPKRVLVALEMEDERLPIAGAQVFEADPEKRAKAPRGGVIGALTSSTNAPLRGQKAVGIAMMKWGKHRKGVKVAVAADGEMVEAEVGGLGD